MSIIAPVIVAFSGDWDLSRREELHGKITPLLNAPVAILDLSAVNYVDTSVLSEFVNLRKQRTAKGYAPSLLVIASPMVRKIFQITHLDELWQIYDTLDSALNALPQ
jgi:anti-anti-sigma factor